MARSLSYYLDEHLPRAVAVGLRLRGIDTSTVPEAGMLGAADSAHLHRALAEGRVIVTHDDDFLRLHALGATHAGIVYVSHDTAIGTIVRGLVLIAKVLDAEERQGHVEFL